MKRLLQALIRCPTEQFQFDSINLFHNFSLGLPIDAHSLHINLTLIDGTDPIVIPIQSVDLVLDDSLNPVCHNTIRN